MHEIIEKLAHALLNSSSTVVFTGAGMSTESGLPDFRSPGGLWGKYRPEDLASTDALNRNFENFAAFYRQRMETLGEVRPNSGHLTLAEWERKGLVSAIVTQNVDDLHERAGSRHVLHLHGQLNKLRSCLDERYVIDWQGDQSLETVDHNGYPMRPHIVWFGESVPLFGDAVREIRDADVVLVVGTSLKVYPAASLLSYISPEAEIFVVDPNPQAAWANMEIIPQNAVTGVPSLVQDLIRMASAA